MRAAADAASPPLWLEPRTVSADRPHIPSVPAKAGRQGRHDAWLWITAVAGISGVWVDFRERPGSPSQRGG